MKGKRFSLKNPIGQEQLKYYTKHYFYKQHEFFSLQSLQRLGG